MSIKKEDKKTKWKIEILNIFRLTKVKIVLTIVVSVFLILFFLLGDKIFCEKVPDFGIPRGWMFSNECSVVYIWTTIVLFFLFLPIIILPLQNFISSDVIYWITFISLSFLYIYLIICVILFLVRK